MSEKYKVCLLETREFLHSEGERNVIAETDFLPEVSSNLEIDGELFHVVSTYKRRKMVGVRAFEFNDEDEVDEIYNDDLECPYCGYVDHDAFELDDEGETNCGRCGSELEYSREIVFSYSVSPKKRNEPIKL